MYNMMGWYGGGWGNNFGFAGLVGLLAIWDLVWRGIALWRSARSNRMYWFLGLLVLNTMGILPLIYLLAVENGEFFNQKKKVHRKK